MQTLKDYLDNGLNIYLHGPDGCGKSYLTNKLLDTGNYPNYQVFYGIDHLLASDQLFSPNSRVIIHYNEPPEINLGNDDSYDANHEDTFYIEHVYYPDSNSENSILNRFKLTVLNLPTLIKNVRQTVEPRWISLHNDEILFDTQYPIVNNVTCNICDTGNIDTIQLCHENHIVCLTCIKMLINIQMDSEIIYECPYCREKLILSR